jgi:DNA-binding FadR family transcriptional regulator
MTAEPSNEALFEALLSPAVRTRSLDDVVDKLHDLLISGAVRPDQRLPSERSLSRILEVSRTTVREALRKLEAQGLVQIRVGGTGGAYVRSPDSGMVSDALAMLLAFDSITEADLHDYRFDFEVENAGLAALRATDAEKATMIELRDEAQRLLLHARQDSAGAWPAVKAHDLRVHEYLPVATHNTVRMAISRAVHDALGRSFDAVVPPPDSSVALAGEVIALLDPIIAGNSAEARQAMADHLTLWRR